MHASCRRQPRGVRPPKRKRPNTGPAAAQGIPVEFGYSAGPNTASILVLSVAALNGLTM